MRCGIHSGNGFEMAPGLGHTLGLAHNAAGKKANACVAIPFPEGKAGDDKVVGRNSNLGVRGLHCVHGIVPKALHKISHLVCYIRILNAGKA